VIMNMPTAPEKCHRTTVCNAELVNLI